jgi:alkylhydroperoxidase/carboxymuconolactone decarboxylase family protein YurZ
MKAIAPAFHEVASEFWRVPMRPGQLSARMKELILLAMHVSATSLNVDAVRRQVHRVLAAGGTQEEIADAVTTIATLANHSVYASVPVLEEEWEQAGGEPPAAGELGPAMEAVKRRFVEIRGFWNAEREPLMRQMPDYFAALTGLGTVTWEQGPLSRKERELVCVGIDCTVTHTYVPGLRTHIRNAIREGATREEILEVFQLAALMGLESYVLVAEAMFAHAHAPGTEKD